MLFVTQPQKHENAILPAPGRLGTFDVVELVRPRHHDGFPGPNCHSIGPMSALVMMELNETNHTDSCFDYQDAILIITLSKNHPNNGHGNNLDGVDSSNPGGGSGGPNGEIDPSGGVDDEIR